MTLSLLIVSAVISSETLRTWLQDVFSAASLLMLDNFTAIVVALVCVAAACPFLFLVVSSAPRSAPGGPRQPTIRRPKPSTKKWAGEDLPNAVLLVAEASIKASNSKLPLTGEPAGRQTWHEVSESEGLGLSKEERRLLRFCAAENPNASDGVLRALSANREDVHVRDSETRPTASSEASSDTFLASARRGLRFYASLQCPDGHWAGDYGGPLFLLPGLVIGCYISDVSLPPWKQRAIARYFLAHQQADGGWGTHIEGASTMFGSVLCYVSLRILGKSPEDPALTRGRLFLQKHGGALRAPSWAKFWLALLNVMEWRAINPVPPELWALPRWLPFHPGRMWCHSRMVYLPMSFLYGLQFSKPLTELTRSLRAEIYALADGESYDSIDWSRARGLPACALDSYDPPTFLMRSLQAVLALYERRPLLGLRDAGMKFAWEYLQAEDQHTHYINIGPVSKVLNMVCVWAKSGRCEALDRHVARLEDYLWLAEDGMKMQGYNGSQLWDTAFATQAIFAAGLHAEQEFQSCVQRAAAYIDRSQIREDVAQATRFFRHASRGGWPFSTAAHGWPISDCTAEGLKASLLVRAAAAAAAESPHPGAACGAGSVRGLVEGAGEGSRPAAACGDGGGKDGVENQVENHFENEAEKGGVNVAENGVVGPRATSVGPLSVASNAPPASAPLPVLSDPRLREAVDLLLSMQNDDGGWATYELTRGWRWFELLNPSEVFGDIMVDYSYVECSAAAISALQAFRAHFEHYRAPEIRRAVSRGRKFILSLQRKDGSWYGSWGVCFTYATWFGLKGLRAAGESPRSAPVRAARDFLLRNQAKDGGWGESFLSCADKRYTQNEREGSQVVNTAWAMLALLEAGTEAQHPALGRAAAFLRESQQEDGDWPQQSVSGVFNRSCGITYTAYRNVFPIWALGKYARKLSEEERRTQRAR